jgi:hypothetical protein
VALVYPTWKDWDMPWNSIRISPNFPIDICGDFSGYTYHAHESNYDAGSPFTGYAVIATDLSQHQKINRYKRLLAVEPYFRKDSGGSATISIKSDNETAFIALGDVSLSNKRRIFSQVISCDLRGKSFELKISGDNMFRFLGVIFHYVWSGVR